MLAAQVLPTKPHLGVPAPALSSPAATVTDFLPCLLLPLADVRLVEQQTSGFRISIEGCRPQSTHVRVGQDREHRQQSEALGERREGSGTCSRERRRRSEASARYIGEASYPWAPPTCFVPAMPSLSAHYAHPLACLSSPSPHLPLPPPSPAACAVAPLLPPCPRLVLLLTPLEQLLMRYTLQAYKQQAMHGSATTALTQGGQAPICVMGPG